MPLKRRDLIAIATLTPLALAVAPARAQDEKTFDPAKLMKSAGEDAGLPDRFEGQKDAKVTVIEYSSPTCPHCADFALKVYPELKTKYIETGDVLFILRPFVRNVLDAVVYMLAETAPDTDGYIKIVNTFLDTQTDWAVSDKPKDAMLKVAEQLGFTKESFDKALTNQDLFNALEKVRDQAINDFDLTGTPTFYVNGKQLVGFQNLDEMSAAIDPLLK